MQSVGGQYKGTWWWQWCRHPRDQWQSQPHRPPLTWACGQDHFGRFLHKFFGNFLLLLRSGFKSVCEATLFSFKLFQNKHSRWLTLSLCVFEIGKWTEGSTDCEAGMWWNHRANSISFMYLLLQKFSKPQDTPNKYVKFFNWIYWGDIG